MLKCWTYSRRTMSRWRGPVISRWSRHARRSVLINRSAIAFARGARIGVWMIRMSAPVNTASKAAVNLLSRVTDQEPEPVGVLVKLHQQVAGLLCDPGPGGVCGDSGEVHAAATVLDHEQDVEAVQEHGVDMREVDREDRVGLRGQELSPGRTRRRGAGSSPASFKIFQTVEAATEWPRPTSLP